MMVDEQQLDEKPRMADFLEWAVATGDAFGWSSDKIINAFNQNQRASLSVIADSDPLLEAIQMFLERNREWDGTASELLNALREDAGRLPDKHGASYLPKAANILVRRLNRGKEALESRGIEVTYSRAGKRRRLIHLRLVCLADECSE